jgi:hypothetical protein
VAIDTQRERQAAHRYAAPWARMLPLTDGSVTAADRAMLLGFYVAGATPPPASLDLAPPYGAEWIDPARGATWIDPARGAEWSD